ncbi:wall-associated receptor kinase 5-like [Typha latifolia]|uniref:wall-associated receptor kinase 5-like n=1 Tax=Typha latifolia TaxID=4733 RepID=UPI003C2FD292
MVMKLLVLVVLLLGDASAANISLPGCRDKCGDVSVPHPFGIGDGCYVEGLNVSCNESYSPPRPFINPDINTQMQVLEISLVPANVRVLLEDAAYDCYAGNNNTDWSDMGINISATAYLFSDTRNVFTAIGCATVGYIEGQNGDDIYGSGCSSRCKKLDSVASGGLCTRAGCCQTNITKGLDYFIVTLGNLNHTDVWTYSPCSFGMLVEKGWYNFSVKDLPGQDFLNNRVKKTGYPVMLDWVIPNASCPEAKRRPDYPCRSANSVCQNSTRPQGYTCECAQGYEGNPFMANGCQDVDECAPKGENRSCFWECTNLEGSYSCTCPRGTKGNADERHGCHRDDKMDFLKPVIGGGIGLFFLVATCFLAYLGFEKNKLSRTKRKFFEQNGGLLLQQEMINSHNPTTFRIYTREELTKATNNFDKTSIIGRGGQGIVYGGVLEDKRTVAVKKSRIMDESRLKEYTRETLILSQINHKNVVKLLGCCLEVEVPMLVYEFISNRTLFHHLHDVNVKWPMPLDTRLKIAIESAQALAYLHSWASPPILHGDVKSANILLDEQLTAKVSDFGTAKLAPTDETQLATLVQGTCGYLDPEYMQTCQLTDKSDVYSFAVVLLELLTGKRALYFEGSEEERSLVFYFNSAMREGKFFEILDDQVKHEGDAELFQEIAELIDRCLSFKGVERPTMKEVAEVLERLRRLEQSLWTQPNSEEMDCELGETSSFPAGDTTADHNVEGNAIISIGEGR